MSPEELYARWIFEAVFLSMFGGLAVGILVYWLLDLATRRNR